MFKNNKIGFLLIIILQYFLFSNCQKDYENNSQQQFVSGKFTWMYDFDVNSNNDKLITGLKATKTDNVILSLNPCLLTNSNVSFTTHLIDFLKKCKTNGIKFHANILEDANYILTANQIQATERVECFLDFCRSSPDLIENPIYGIHIDLEPYTLSQWDKGNQNDKENLLLQYQNLRKKIYTMVKSENSTKNLRISGAVSCFLDDQYRAGILPSGKNSEQVRYLDAVFPMAYLSDNEANQYGLQKKAEIIIDRVKDEVNEVPTVIGLEVNNFDTYEDLLTLEQILNNEFKGKNLGFCYFKYSTLISHYNNK
jgi:hypothetical protein